MNRKKVILLTLVLVLVVLVGAVASAEGEAFSVRWNSGLGGGSGGGLSNSPGFTLAGSAMGGISLASNSPSYQMCVGFLCAEGGLLKVLLPVIYRQEP